MPKGIDKFVFIAHSKIVTLTKDINQNDFLKRLVKSFSVLTNGFGQYL